LQTIYDGLPKAVKVSTVPSGLSVAITYNGSVNPPSAAGTYAVVGTVSDLNYVGAASGSLAIVEASRTFSSWVVERFTPAQIIAGEADALADPDRDGVVNLGEYALGGNPYGFTPQPDVVADSSSLAITFQRPARTHDVVYCAEVSANFVDWTAVTLDVLSSGFELETIRGTYRFPSPKPDKTFIRLRFEK